jgi:hypothetical protein
MIRESAWRFSEKIMREQKNAMAIQLKAIAL